MRGFANYYTKNQDVVKCPTPTDCTANATVRQYNYLAKQYTLRQNIVHVAYCERWGAGVEYHFQEI